MNDHLTACSAGSPLWGGMQPRQLRVTDILQYAVEAHPTREIVSRDPEGETWRGNYAALARIMRERA